MKPRSLVLNCVAIAAALFVTTAPCAAPPAEDAVIPLIEMDNVPLTDAIRKIAAMARLNIILDPRLSAPPHDRIAVSIRWQDVTAKEALTALLDNHDLVLVETPRPSSSR